MSYAAFVMLTATAAWLALSDDERRHVVEEHLQPTLARHRERIRVSYYDTEAYAARPSDLLVLEFAEPHAHAPLIDALRSTPIFAEPYFVLESLVVGERASWLDPR